MKFPKNYLSEKKQNKCPLQEIKNNVIVYVSFVRKEKILSVGKWASTSKPYLYLQRDLNI